MLRERDQVLRLVPQRARVPQSAASWPSAPAGGHAQEGIATGVRSTVAAMCWTQDQHMPATPLTSLPRSQAATKSSRQDLAILRIIWHMLRERDQVLRLVPQRARVPQSAASWPSAPAGGHAQEGIATGVRSTVAAMCWTQDQNMPATPLTRLPRLDGIVMRQRE